MSYNKNAVIIPVVAILAGLGYYLAYKALVYIEDLDDTIQKKQETLKALESDITRAEPYVALWNNIKAFLDEEPGDRLTAYGDFLISLETERNFDLQSTPEERKLPNNDQMQEIIFSLDFASNINDLAEFLAKLDGESEKLLQIKSLTVVYRGKPLSSTYTGINTADNKELSVAMVLATPSKKSTNITEENLISGLAK